MSPFRNHRLARLVASLAGLAGVAIMLAGCGGKSPSPAVANLGPTTSTTTSTTTTPPASPSGGSVGTASGGGAALRISAGGKNLAQFASCMRTHGEPNFPDPNAQGQISIDSSAGIDPQSAQFQSAQHACAKYLPNGGQPPSPAQQARMQQQALRFSACMRSHGVPKFPDPEFGNGKVAIHIDASSGIDPQSPTFRAAQQACQGLLPGKAGPGSAKVGTSAGGK